MLHTRQWVTTRLMLIVPPVERMSLRAKDRSVSMQILAPEQKIPIHGVTYLLHVECVERDCAYDQAIKTRDPKGSKGDHSL